MNQIQHYVPYWMTPADREWLGGGVKRNLAHDFVDRQHGQPTPLQGGLSCALRVAIDALVAAHHLGDWSRAAEAAGLVVRVERELREFETSEFVTVMPSAPEYRDDAGPAGHG